MSDYSGDVGVLENPEQAGEGKPGIVKRWLLELDLAEKLECDWRKNAEDAKNRYRDESSKSVVDNGRYSSGTRFNILYSNIQTICPALYNQLPKPDVRRRFRDKDPIAKYVSEVLERGISYTLDASDFNEFMKMANKDNQLVGRGVTRVRYRPYFGEEEEDENGEMFQPLTFSEVYFQHVQWKDFRHGPGRTWKEVQWVAFCEMLDKDQLEDKFGEAAKGVSLDYSVDGTQNEDDQSEVEDVFKRAKVWEIWCKRERKVYFIAESLKERPLKVEDDPLNLDGFFDIPEPLYATQTSDSLIPIEPYRYYKDQAEELDCITKRISGVIEACKVCGVYDATIQEMANMMDSGENILTPSENIMQILSNGGNLGNAVFIWPIEKIAQVLVYLYQQRDQIKTTIYEITGIADIMRGSTAASETLGAQQLKAQFGTMRLEDMRSQVERYARDCCRITAEIISEQFTIENLQMMTGVELATADEKAMLEYAARSGRELPEEYAKLLDRPTWEEVKSVMESDLSRGYRIDIETDSTVTGDIATEQQNMTEMLAGIASFVQSIGPAVASGYFPEDAAKSLLASAIRRFRMGREVEDAIDAVTDEESPQNKVSPELMQAQQQMQEMQGMFQQLQQENEQLKQDKSLQAQKLEIDAQKAMADYQLKKQDIDAKIAKMAADTQRQNMTTVTPQQQWAYDMEKEREKQAFEAGQNELDREHDMEMKAVDVAKDGIMIMRDMENMQ